MTKAAQRGPRLLLVGAGLALAVALSCKTFDLPNETCDPARLDANRQRGQSADGECTRCLEDSCCDAVGVCERKEGCAERVSGAHECVLSAGRKGAELEAKCAEERGLASDPEAKAAYRCMRDRCGAPCGLPVCRVNQAAVLFGSAKCDSCFSSSCCPQLNACYESRACKLMIECVASKCGGTIGASLLAGRGDPRLVAGGEGAALARIDVARVCGPSGADELAAPTCVRDCLCEFRDHDQGLRPEAQPPSFLLGFDVYACGVAAECGGACSIDAGPSADDAGASAGDAAASAGNADASADAATD